MNLEDIITELNISTFLREFTVTGLTQKFQAKQEIELCDGLVLLDQFLLAFQLKQRTNPTGNDEKELKWFTNKVSKNATGQMKSTIEHLKMFGGTCLPNSMGRNIPLPADLNNCIAKYVIVYSNPHLKGKVKRHHKSQKTNIFTHILELSEWRDVIEALVTPVEIEEYLSYREQVLSGAADSKNLSEHTLLGGFFANESVPTEDARRRYARVLNSAPDLDISIILTTMGDRLYEHDRELLEHAPSALGQDTNDYYPILAELAKMHRSELISFKRMWAESWSSMGSFSPRRLHFPPSPRSFAFMTVAADLAKHRLAYLNYITDTAKYTTHTDTCIGMCFTKHDGGEATVDWLMISVPWLQNHEFESFIKSENPFPTSRGVVVPRYPENKLS